MSEEGDRGKKENRAGNRYGQNHLFWHHYHFGLLQSSFGTAVGDRFFLLSEQMDGRIAAHLIQLAQVKGNYKTEINEKQLT